MLKKNQTEILEMKNSRCQIKNTVEGVNTRFSEAEERMSELETKL